MSNLKIISFAALGMVTLAVSLTACQTYDNQEVNYELANNQNGVSLTLGDSYLAYLYNVKEPINVELKAPKDYKIIINNKEYPNYLVHLNPQESINISFKIKKDGKDKSELIEAHVITFKDVFKPINRAVLEERSGKSTNFVGEKVYFSLNTNPHEVLVDLHEYNKRKKHYFYYTNGTKDVLVKMIAPKYTSFVFENGIKTKDYTFTLKKGDEYHFSMNLSNDNNNYTYSRTYRFKRN